MRFQKKALSSRYLLRTVHNTVYLSNIIGVMASKTSLCPPAPQSKGLVLTINLYTTHSNSAFTVRRVNCVPADRKSRIHSVSARPRLYPNSMTDWSLKVSSLNCCYRMHVYTTAVQVHFLHGEMLSLTARWPFYPT